MAQIKNGDDVFYYQNHINGSPNQLVDIEGNHLWEQEQTAWGKTLCDENSALRQAHQPLRFQGQYFDEETGLHYNTFRYYNPHCGRFISQDPIGLNGGFNLYQYAPNPISWIDPWGLKKNANYYHGPKPKYENPGHHDPSSGKFRGGGSKTSILPKNAEELYKKAIPDKTGTHWYATDKDGTVHRFGNSNDGKAHWNGDSKQNRGIKVPSDVQKRLNEIERDKKNGTYGKKDC